MKGMAKKLSKKTIEKKISRKKIAESKEPLEEKIENSGEEINNQKFLEFLSVSTDPIETFASKKPRNAKPIEQDREILSVNIQENNQDKEKKEKTDYFARAPSDYNLVSPREEKKQTLSIKTFEPQKVNIQEMGREMQNPLRDVFIPESGINRQTFSKREGIEKDYTPERVDFTEVGREKRYKLMK
jgi:hypothetical protein